MLQEQLEIPIKTEIRFHDRTIELVDTAGMRKPGKQEVGIEKSQY